MHMSQFSNGIFAALAVSVSLGAAQFAAGRDLAGDLQASMGTPVTAINRTAKADRAPVARSDVPTQTISLRLNGVSRHLGAGPDSRRPSRRQGLFSALAVQVRKRQDDGSMRTRRQRADRDRQTARPGTLRDLIRGAHRDCACLIPPPSSTGSTGRSSISETSAIDTKGRGVLDTPHARG